MKKLLVSALALVLVLALAACGGGASSSAPASTEPASVASSTMPEESVAASSTPASEAASTPAAEGTFEADGRQYITADQLKADLEADADSVFLLDIQPEENFNENHLKGAVATYAFPVETDDEKAAIDAVLPDAGGKALVIVCPGGKGGANNTWDHLVASDYDMSNVFILENGQNGWPHADLLDA